MDVFLAPHPDDEVLFGAFTLLRHRPRVIIVLDCGPDRTEESVSAGAVLGVEVTQWPYPEPSPDWDAIARRLWALPAIRKVFAPAYAEGGNPDHNHVAELAPAAANRYLTYTDAGKQTEGLEVNPEPEWIGLKHRALACFASQFRLPGRAEHFLRDIREYAAVT